MFTLQPNVPMSQTRTNGLLRADLYKDAEYQSREKPILITYFNTFFFASDSITYWITKTYSQ